ncbi:MAG TPA: YqgE/AlgH family protein [Rhodobacteraceae bacterium]|nr:YqgE/AlgH family protein [Paracoccaceae bacterium]
MNLTGKLLIAMPGMGDPRFDHSVVFLCSHDDEAAMGLIVNKPSADVTMKELMTQLELTPGPGQRNVPVYFGGPVEGARGFVLHTPDYASNLQTLAVNDGFAMTATLDILEDIAEGRGPERSMMVLGYAGWGPGQLESEIAMNGWLTTEADPKLVFDTPNAEKWGAALARLGVDPLTLSADAGRA